MTPPARVLGERGYVLSLTSRDDDSSHFIREIRLIRGSNSSSSQSDHQRTRKFLPRNLMSNCSPSPCWLRIWFSVTELALTSAK